MNTTYDAYISCNISKGCTYNYIIIYYIILERYIYKSCKSLYSTTKRYVPFSPLIIENLRMTSNLTRVRKFGESTGL